MKSISEMLSSAVGHQQAGRLQDAEALYREILARDDRQADAWHLLGTIAHQIGDHVVAIDLIGHAIELESRNANFHCNLGNALLATGQMDEAEQSYRRALDRKRDFPLAWFNLSSLLAQTGQLDEAITGYQEAIRLKPDFVEAHYNLALLFQGHRRWDAASSGYQRTLQLRPNHAEAWNNLGLVLKELGNIPEAIECHRRAIQFKPDYAEAFNNLGVACREQREVNRALECYTQALQLKPDYAAAFNNLGNLLQSMGRPSDAVTCLKRAIELQPGFAEAYTNLGAALQDLRRWNEAADSLRAALDLNPDDAAALQSLGNVVRDGGDTAEAIACYRRSLELKPDCLSALGQLIHQLQHQCAWDELPSLTDRAIRAVADLPLNSTDSPMSPFAFLTMPIATSSQQQQKCAARWAAFSTRTAVKVPHPWWEQATRETVGEQRIRIGYLSADFRAHPVAELIVELFESHDRSQFEVTGYSYGPNDGSLIRQRISKAFERFVDLRELPLADSIQKIVDDRIDILVDLTGFTQHSRPEILASSPAPIRVNYLGYPGTMGADFADYIMVDHFIVPADRQPFYSEKLVHLPGCYQVNDTQRIISETVPSRTEVGLPDEAFVFCSFNSNYKITPEIFEVWMRLLQKVPGSVLWLLESNRQAPVNLRREAERRGVAPERLVFAPRRPLTDHLARHQLADLFLDTFPVNAHTTASDALWAGLPVLTLSGETFVSRVAGSLLHSLGLPELITDTLVDYEARALDLARDRQELAALRQRLQANRLSSPVFDIQRAARAIEQAYRTMQTIRELGEKPRSFAVS
jgi:protein O-GlcNAc transferase